jgi:hypothetical protein
MHRRITKINFPCIETLKFVIDFPWGADYNAYYDAVWFGNAHYWIDDHDYLDGYAWFHPTGSAGGLDQLSIFPQDFDGLPDGSLFYF